MNRLPMPNGIGTYHVIARGEAPWQSRGTRDARKIDGIATACGLAMTRNFYSEKGRLTPSFLLFPPAGGQVFGMG